jgi:hypothetical protein
MVLALALCPRAWGQERTGRAAGEQGRNPTARGAQNDGAGQNRNQPAAGTETIRGAVAGVTAEGEVMLDYRTNVAARTEGAFLTVVGSPIKSETSAEGRRPATSGSEKHGLAGGKRHNVYIVWMTPRTKVWEATEEPGRSNQDQRENRGQTQSQSGSKEVTLDKLEVGDHVEIQFTHHEQSGATNDVHQTQRMREKHGRHRTFVGTATSITILPPMEHQQSGSRREARSFERPR